MGIRATLNFRKFKVALNPMYRIFSNFVKNYILSCPSNIKFVSSRHHVIFSIYIRVVSLVLLNEPIRCSAQLRTIEIRSYSYRFRPVAVVILMFIVKFIYFNSLFFVRIHPNRAFTNWTLHTLLFLAHVIQIHAISEVIYI